MHKTSRRDQVNKTLSLKYARFALPSVQVITGVQPSGSQTVVLFGHLVLGYYM